LTFRKVSTLRRRPARRAPDVPLERGLDLLTLLMQAPEGMTLTELAATLNEPLIELSRAILVLSRRQWLSVDPVSGRVRPGGRMLRMSSG
jgi:DNA-binding IclR family transcriptional regulator